MTYNYKLASEEPQSRCKVLWEHKGWEDDTGERDGGSGERGRNKYWISFAWESGPPGKAPTQKLEDSVKGEGRRALEQLQRLLGALNAPAMSSEFQCDKCLL